MEDCMIQTDIGVMQFCFEHDKIIKIAFLGINNDLLIDHSPSAKKMQQLVGNYLLNGKMPRNLSTEEKGTVFQKRVWSALRDIESGTTLTYGALAKKLQTSARAVGGACRANPLVLFTPCHRVVSSTGLGGFAGATEGSFIDIKKYLLNKELKNEIR